MNNPLIASLGLDKADGDMNLPDGSYDGKVRSSRLVYVPSKDTLNHVIEFAVTDGDYKGRSHSEWFTLGSEPRVGDNETPAKGEVDLSQLTHLTGTQSDQQKDWYKKRHMDLGVDEQDFNSGKVMPGDLANIPVTFGVKTRTTDKGRFTNISFAVKRDEDSNPADVPASLGEL